jgi:hypothetical protein
MITFKEFIENDVTEEEIDSLIESIEWEDIIDMYDKDELVIEGITNIERFKKGQRLKSRKVLMALSRNIKLKRAATPDVIQRRSQTDARKLIMKKLLKGRKKSQLSAAEKNFVEMRTSQMINKNFVARLVPKVKQIDRNRLAGKNK